MKNYAILLSIFFLISCSTESTESIENPELNVETSKESVQVSSNPSNNKLVSRTVITCQGNCNGTASPCKVGQSTSNPDYFECNCAGCELHVINEKTASRSSYTSKDLLTEEFLKFVTKQDVNRNADFIYINEIIYEEYTDMKIVFYDYDDADGENQTVLLVDRKSEGSKNGDPTIIVDCKGGCEGSQTCRERYVGSTGDVECTCEGSCVMEITVKE